MVQRSEILLPLELLRSERETLNTQIQDLHSQVEAARRALAVAEKSEREASARVDRLGKQLNSIQKKLNRLESNLTERRSELADLKTQMREHEPALHFLMALPRAATAPLWAEVVRIALDQGEIDDLAYQALERLAFVCPTEALPLLAEIAARAPKPFRIPAEAFQQAAATWFAGIAEGRVLIEQDEVVAAAQRLVDAWSAFFKDVSEATASE